MVRVILFSIALVSGGIAAWLVGAMQTRSVGAAQTSAAPDEIRTMEVLVAASLVEQGAQLRADQLRWQTWPANAVSEGYILRADRPNADIASIGSQP